MSLEDRLEELEGSDTWSVSALKTIGSCGKQYEFRYRQETHSPEATPPLAFGSAVHKCIERLHKEDNQWEPRLWQRMWSEIWFEYASKVQWGGFGKGAFDKLGTTMIANYIDAHRGANILEIECKFPDQKGQEYKIGRFPTKGIVDQVRRQPNGKLLVVDLKTGKDKPDPLLLRADPQFTLYWNFVTQKYGEEPDLAWFHLRTGEIMYTSRTSKDLDVVEESLKDAQKRVDNKMFARNINYGCKFCPFVVACLGPIGSGNG